MSQDTIIKTYHCNLVGNNDKIDSLNYIYNKCQEIANFLLKFIKENREYRKSEIHNQTYFKLREMFPDINSKLIQTVRDKVLSSVKAKKLFKVKKIQVPIIIDYQSFNLKFDQDKFFDCFLRFFKINFPLEGKRMIQKLIKVNKVKRIELIPKNNGKYFKVFFNCEVESKYNRDANKKLGLDTNLKNITLSNGKRFNLKPYISKKLRFRQHKNIPFIQKWSQGYVRSLCSEISKYLIENQVGCLIIENLKDIRDSFSRKKKTSKGKLLNYLINNCFPYAMFFSYLEDSCSNQGIKVIKINPKNTSKTCSSCGHLNTIRKKQSLLYCHDCNLKHNADLNAAKNILSFHLRMTVMSEGRNLAL